MKPKKKKKKPASSSTRSTAEKPRDAVKGGSDEKVVPITGSYFMYYLIFHYHTTAYRKRLRGWRKEIEN